jgi:hypothetical protein
MEDQEMLKLVEAYKKYEGATQFIYGAFEALAFKKKNSAIKYFIQQVFAQSQIDCIDYVVCKRLSSHWRKVAVDKLNMEDYQNYNYCMITSTQLAIVGKFLESNIFKYQ